MRNNELKVFMKKYYFEMCQECLCSTPLKITSTIIQVYNNARSQVKHLDSVIYQIFLVVDHKKSKGI